MYNDYYITMIILIPASIFAMYAQYKVSHTFQKYSKMSNGRGFTGRDVAIQLLNLSGITDVAVEHIRGNMTDHYDPVHKVLRLSDTVYNRTSVAAIGVAAHETGHAVQHHVGYKALSVRNGIFPLVSFSSKISTPLIFLGLSLSFASGGLGYILLLIGVVLFACVVLFQLITLPVEFNASKRAVDMLDEYHFMSADEMEPVKKVLSAAALTYVAAAAVAISNLLRFVFILLSGRRRND